MNSFFNDSSEEQTVITRLKSAEATEDLCVVGWLDEKFRYRPVCVGVL